MSSQRTLTLVQPEQKPHVFEFGKNPVRVVIRNGEPWWIATDVCQALKHTNSRMALQRLDPDEKGVTKVYTPGGPQNIQVINEPGLYSLILRSNLAEARAFKRWVTHEVLPQIRKTGGYHVPQSFADALQLAADFQRKIEQQQPKVEFYDAIIDSKDTFLIGDVAKNLQVPGMGPNKLFQFLRRQKVLKSDNLPYQQYIELGWFRVVEQQYPKKDGETGVTYRTRVYQRGVDGIRKLLKWEGLL